MNRFTISLLGFLLFALVGCSTSHQNTSTDRPVVKSDVSEHPSDNDRISLKEQLPELDNTSNQDSASNQDNNFNQGRGSRERVNIESSNDMHSFLLSGSSLMISLISLFFASRASLRAQKQAHRLQNLKKEVQGIRQEIYDEMEIKLNLYSQQAALSKPSIDKASRFQAITNEPLVDSIALSFSERAPQPTEVIRSSVPADYNIESLINALNNGDRQILKEAATAELNITNDSQSKLAIGKTITTELEVVPGGGSYWLIELQGHAWLFPTEGTLRGFEAEQPTKGIFTYQQQTISKAKLIEPAALECSGNLWKIKTMGRVATP